VNPATLNVIWWRRANLHQRLPEDITEPSHIDLINNDCRTALQGILLSEFHGRWVSNPAATTAAENKLVQLRAAVAAGLAIPRTLVTQDVGSLKRFQDEVGGEIVIKAVRGTRQAALLSSRLTDAHFDYPDSIKLSPTIYQECVSGTSHLRVCCFGDRVVAVRLESEDLDWRANLEIPAAPYSLEPDTQRKLIRLLEILGLRMGVFDLKLNCNGQPVYLEVNPQGQFLFMEGMSGVDVTTPCLDFLSHEASLAVS
jgi:glutathione synthase/RimK-type ligase-like ATP-grasp enzyme